MSIAFGLEKTPANPISPFCPIGSHFCLMSNKLAFRGSKRYKVHMRKALLLTPCGARVKVSMPIFRDQVERLVGGHIEVVYFKDEGGLLCSDTFLRDHMPRNASAELLVPGATICGPVVVFERDSDVRRVLSAYSWQKRSVGRVQVDWKPSDGADGTIDIRTCVTCEHVYVSMVGSMEKRCYVCRCKTDVGEDLVRNHVGQLVPPETLTMVEAE